MVFTADYRKQELSFLPFVDRPIVEAALPAHANVQSYLTKRARAVKAMGGLL